MSAYISFEIRRGDEYSAPASELAFDVLIDDSAADRLNFKLRFENPTSVSIGLSNDVMIGTILDESFFCSKDSPMTITKGTEIRTVLPRLLPGEEFEAVLDTAAGSIDNSTRTMMTG